MRLLAYMLIALIWVGCTQPVVARPAKAATYVTTLAIEAGQQNMGSPTGDCSQCTIPTYELGTRWRGSTNEFPSGTLPWLAAILAFIPTLYGIAVSRGWAQPTPPLEPRADRDERDESYIVRNLKRTVLLASFAGVVLLISRIVPVSLRDGIGNHLDLVAYANFIFLAVPCIYDQMLLAWTVILMCSLLPLTGRLVLHGGQIGPLLRRELLWCCLVAVVAIENQVGWFVLSVTLGLVCFIVCEGHPAMAPLRFAVRACQRKRGVVETLGCGALSSGGHAKKSPTWRRLLRIG